ncbi:MAG: hypothetical protein AAGC53_13535 [Actinomycetota bacterium]
MTKQLLLIDSRPAWRLDQATRDQGLEGVANARAVLRAIDARRAAEIAQDAPEDSSVITIDAGEQATLPLADAA